jgi:hypothetical protein
MFQKSLLLLAFCGSSLFAEAQISKKTPTDKPVEGKSTPSGITKGSGAVAPVDLMETTTETVTVKPAYRELSVVPAEYRTVTEQVLIRPAHLGGSTFTTVTEQVLVKEASRRFEVTPAVWQSVEKEIITEQPCDKSKKPTKTKYGTEVMVTPTQVREIEIPAEYITIVKNVVNVAGTGPQQNAEYRTIEKQVLFAPPSIREIEIPVSTKKITVKRCKLK